MSTTTSPALRLKDEGNALFRRKEFKQALEKYSEAIELDGTNAVLFANRAACFLSLDNYFDARYDALKATELDPTYPKAWARLAAAEDKLGAPAGASLSWKRAIDALPKNSELSLADTQQRELYQENFQKAKAREVHQAKEMRSAHKPIEANQCNDMPWNRAENMREELVSSNTAHSSAWIILGAYQDWKSALFSMNKLTKGTRDGKPGWRGETGAVQFLTNAVIRDRRIFTLQPGFLSQFVNQLKFESSAYNSYPYVEGDPQNAIKAATDRLRTESWDTVRNGLSIAVRSCLLQGFLSYSVFRAPGPAVLYLTTCIDTLEAGLTQWPTVPKEQKGAMFCRSFVRGVKALRLEAFAEASAVSAKKFPLEKLEEYANELFADAQSDPYIQADPGFLQSFWEYPKGEATAILGGCRARRAEKCESGLLKFHLWKTAGEYYEKASLFYPDDEEKKCWFINTALDCYHNAQAPLFVILPLLVKLKECYPKMMRIWEFSQMTLIGRDEALQKKLSRERELQQKLAEDPTTDLFYF